jgi:hypothetical protein
MEEILRRNPKVVVDSGLQNIVPLLNLGDGRSAVPAGAVAPQVLRPGPQTNVQGNAGPVPARPQGFQR